MANHRTNLDEYTFAMDVASGALTHAQIAEKHGISEAHVSEIVRGKSRPHVAEIIAELSEANRQRAKARLAMLIDKAVSTIAGAMDGGANTTAFSAAKEVLNRTLGDPGRPEISVGASQEAPEDYGEYLKWKCRKEGGPDEA